MKDKRKEVSEFLREFKRIAAKNKRIYVPKRPKNIEALVELGITYTIRDSMLFALSTDDYCSGPDRDNDMRGYVWVFGIDHNGFEIYVKLKIKEYLPKNSTTLEQQVACISFHKTDRPMKYPLKKKDEKEEENE